jgi:hypothetical protein
MQPSAEVEIDLTTQELLDPPPLTSQIEVDDIGDIDPLLRTGSFVANAAAAPAADPLAADGSVEIELTADQMDALLDEPLPR